MTKSVFTIIIAIIASMLHVVRVQAQQVRTSYFMNGEPIRLNLNPALVPTNGFYSVPMLQLGVSMSSNVFGTRYFSDFISNDDKGDTFTSNSFLKNLEDRNYFNMRFDFNILSFGWWKRDAFWNVDIALRTITDIRFPRRLFTFMNDMRSATDIDWKDVHYDLSGNDATLTSYLETGIGYAKPIGSKLTIGGKAKFLLGIVNVHASIDKMQLDIDLSNVEENIDWSEVTPEEVNQMKGSVDLDMHTIFNGYCKSIDFVKDFGSDKLDDVDFSSFNFSGKGVAFDIGAQIQFNEKLNLSLAFTDIGFIKWKGDAHREFVSVANTHYTIPDNTEAIIDLLSSREAFNSEAIDQLDSYVVSESKSDSCSWLNANIVAGFEFKPIEKISLGLLSTSYLARKSSSEITFSFVYSPVKKINLALSCSLLQSRARSFGVGIGLGRILFIGTDYMWLKNDSKVSNAVIGMTVPLRSRESKQKKQVDEVAAL